MTQLIFIRHGETETNVAKKLHKDTDPTELNETGKEQIRKAAKAIEKRKLTKIFCSREKRAIQSAEIIASICGAEVEQIDGLQERNWGDFSGKTWPEIQKVLDNMTLDERFNYVPPNGESWKQFDKRLKTRLDEIVNSNPDGVVAVVSHGGAIRALMPHLLGVPKEESFKYDPDNASLTIFKAAEGKYTKVSVNDTTHLK